ncbi:DEAD/DEAH box helicase [Streptomyces sp. NA04227]|uniref:DUF6286 domain-containing protein n=1 Tax=Streptomyces sp. NA04227 TaxID=2742136 RepID=UPI0015911C37|nr:DUF6286 domain-containing protein [Streptomyces sp. NA04227]QKW10501.1 DEAD/DEAH box helicase [Streptomyces sp. NA04227]
MEPAGARGATTVADRAVRRIAEHAAAEAIEGGEQARRVGLSRKGTTARLSLEVRLPYPGDLPASGERIRRHVTRRTEELTGLSVPSTRVLISRLETPGKAGRLDGGSPDVVEPVTREAQAGGAAGRHSSARPWSARRLPAALAAAALAAGAGALLADAVAVRAGRTVAAWRRNAFDELMAVRLGDTWAPWAAAGAAALGLWCVLLALTPGLRRRLPLTTPAADVAVTLDRSAAATVLRTAVLAQNGVTEARVRMGRSRASVRVRVGFGDLEHVGEDVRQALARAVDSCGLTRPVRWRLRLVADENWRAPGASSAGAGDSDDSEDGRADLGAPTGVGPTVAAPTVLEPASGDPELTKPETRDGATHTGSSGLLGFPSPTGSAPPRSDRLPQQSSAGPELFKEPASGVTAPGTGTGRSASPSSPPPPDESDAAPASESANTEGGDR